MGHENPQISVIIPCHNAAKFIAATIESVLEQTLPVAEVLVIDDGSTDNTTAVLAEYENHIRLLRRENGGPAAARNLGIARASGEFIAFLDSDDLWEREKLARQMEEFRAFPETSLVFSEAVMFREAGGVKTPLQRIGYVGDPTFRQLLFGDFIPNSTVIVRRDCVATVGRLNERRDLIGVEDYEYWMRIALRHRLRGIAEPLAWYRLREGNLMGAGDDIEKGLRLAMAAINAIEADQPAIWEEFGVDRARLFARLHLRAGHAWKRRGEWRRWYGQNLAALRQCYHPRVWRWMIAAALLRRWS